MPVLFAQYSPALCSVYQQGTRNSLSQPLGGQMQCTSQASEQPVTEVQSMLGQSEIRRLGCKQKMQYSIMSNKTEKTLNQTKATKKTASAVCNDHFLLCLVFLIQAISSLMHKEIPDPERFCNDTSISPFHLSEAHC